MTVKTNRKTDSYNEIPIEGMDSDEVYKYLGFLQAAIHAVSVAKFKLLEVSGSYPKSRTVRGFHPYVHGQCDTVVGRVKVVRASNNM